jgi:ureidoglycolate lyase
LLALERVSDFLVVDRGGEGPNCDELALPQTWRLERESFETADV